MSQTYERIEPRQRALLAFISGAGPRELDPVRIMKGQFLIAMELTIDLLPDELKYSFEPYLYGHIHRTLRRI